MNFEEKLALLVLAGLWIVFGWWPLLDALNRIADTLANLPDLPIY